MAVRSMRVISHIHHPGQDVNPGEAVLMSYKPRSVAVKALWNCTQALILKRTDAQLPVGGKQSSLHTAKGLMTRKIIRKIHKNQISDDLMALI